MDSNLSPEQAITKFKLLLHPHQASLTFSDHHAKASFRVVPNNGARTLVCESVTPGMFLDERRLGEAAFGLRSLIEKAGR